MNFRSKKLPNSSSDEDGQFDDDDHWFVDAEDDEEFEDMMRLKQQREFGYLGRKRKENLSCPGCFVTFCNDFQRHAYIPEQYRAMFVSNCHYDLEETREIEDEETKEKKTYYKVRCTECESEVGAYDKEEELYHFFDVILGT